MELSEQVTALTSENNLLKQGLENLNAEKIALDQLLVESLKSSLFAKKELIICQSNIQKQLGEISILKSEKEAMQKRIDGLTSDIHRLGSIAQSSEG